MVSGIKSSFRLRTNALIYNLPNTFIEFIDGSGDCHYLTSCLFLSLFKFTNFIYLLKNCSGSLFNFRFIFVSFHTSPPKITLEAAADTAKIITVIGSMQARSYFNCSRSPPYSMAPAKRVRIALIRTI